MVGTRGPRWVMLVIVLAIEAMGRSTKARLSTCCRLLRPYCVVVVVEERKRCGLVAWGNVKDDVLKVRLGSRVSRRDYVR
jgi:hypothetical protein